MLGESAGGLTKFIDYNGHDFDVQFLCVLNGDSAIPDVEMFGKVLVCSVDDTGNESEECSFNLIKKVVRKTMAKRFYLLLGLFIVLCVSNVLCYLSICIAITS